MSGQLGFGGKMEREGFIQYYQTIPNLRLFDRPALLQLNAVSETSLGVFVGLFRLKRKKRVGGGRLRYTIL
jgi:hypothetical protein